MGGAAGVGDMELSKYAVPKTDFDQDEDEMAEWQELKKVVVVVVVVVGGMGGGGGGGG